MKPATLEHLNVTVPDIQLTAQLLCTVFGWTVRWEGDSIHKGYSMHVGEAASYIALYTPPQVPTPAADSYFAALGLNHICVAVDDLDDVERRVKAEGLTTHSHADYEPGRRFYFNMPNGLEVEVVSYA